MPTPLSLTLRTRYLGPFHPRTAFDPYLVPLERGSDGPSLPDGERQRVCQTLQLQVRRACVGPSLPCLEDTRLTLLLMPSGRP